LQQLLLREGSNGQRSPNQPGGNGVGSADVAPVNDDGRSLYDDRLQPLAFRLLEDAVLMTMHSTTLLSAAATTPPT
jgi:hypothetical protein